MRVDNFLKYWRSKREPMPPSAQVEVSQAPYHSSLEYLLEELSRLDLLIRIQLLEQEVRQPVTPFDDFKGLMIGKNEVSRLLDEDNHTIYARNDYQELIFRLSQWEERIMVRRKSSQAAGLYLSLAHLTSIFKLGRLEEELIIICLAPELDRKYEKLYAYLQDDVTRKRPSVDLVFKLLFGNLADRIAARGLFETQGPLIKFLVEFADLEATVNLPLIGRQLKLQDRVVDFLLESNRMDQRLGGFIRLERAFIKSDEACLFETQEELYQVARALLTKIDEKGKRVVFYFSGPVGSGRKTLAEIICRDVALPLMVVDLRKIPFGQLAAGEVLQLLGREALLQQAAVVIDNLQVLWEQSEKVPLDMEQLFETIQTAFPLTFLIADRPWSQGGLTNGLVFIEKELKIPSERYRQRLWENLSRQYRLLPEVDLSDLAAKFRFTPGQIRDSINLADQLRIHHLFRQELIEAEDLYHACHRLSNQKLASLARKIKPRYRWEDLILPANCFQQLQEICNQVKYRQQVYDTWGFERKLSLGKGLTCLFCGGAGTGKTMAAEIIANELSLELYKIDLSQVVSKYIGETEKNLDRIFAEAETANGILFFDEADALFGKRSEVKDAHDRYANIEIGYLLQRVEEYAGIVILATNLHHNMDEAFLRRIQIVIDFPFPDVRQREELWRKVFPVETPLEVDLDYQFLAKRLKIAGGNIKNIALNAAFYAARESGRIEMKHLLNATRQEYQKIGKSLLHSDLEGYAGLLEVDIDVQYNH